LITNVHAIELALVVPLLRATVYQGDRVGEDEVVGDWGALRNTGPSEVRQSVHVMRTNRRPATHVSVDCEPVGLVEVQRHLDKAARHVPAWP
jgi:hypothetical protein